jgi:hypothetical protein
MNLAAVPLHSLVPVVISNQRLVSLPQHYPLLWAMDTYCTGVFSLALIMAFHRDNHTQYNLNQSISVVSDKWRLFVILLTGVVAIARLLLYGSSIELELWYLIPLAMSILYVISARKLPLFLLHRLSAPLYVLASLCLIGGVVLDAPLCRWSVHYQLRRSGNVQLPWFWDLCRLPAIAFGVCDIVFLGLYQHLQNRMRMATNGKSHKA